MNYVAQLLDINDGDYEVNCYVSVVSSKNFITREKRLFKKYPQTESVELEQFVVAIPAPEFLPSDKIMFNHVVDHDVK